MHTMMNRLHTLDYLRGLAAFGIMMFHYLSWTIGEFDSAHFMGRVGIYGVAIFYVLSGLTLHHVYEHNLIGTITQLGDFFKRRILRIHPLLILATVISIFTVDGGLTSFGDILLNITGLFGFVDWSGGIAIGAWSIGNELVFYCFLPVFVLLHQRSKPLFIVFCLLIAGIYFYFAYSLIDPTLTFANTQQRLYYFNPLNQVFLFLAGYLLGVIFEKRMLSHWTIFLLLLVGGVAFVFYPVTGPRLNLVADHARVVFTASCILICLGFYKYTGPVPSAISRPLKTLGEISYSVYMLHPIIHYLVRIPIDYIRQNFFAVPEYVRFFSAIAFTLVLSYVVYNRFEKYFIRLGKPSKSV
jgi:exopolysaccharide production protein ExoZ